MPLFLIIPAVLAGWLRETLRLLRGPRPLRVLPRPFPRLASPPPAPPLHINMTLHGAHRMEQLPPAETSDPKPTREFGFWSLARKPVAHQVSMNKDFFLPFFF